MIRRRIEPRAAIRYQILPISGGDRRDRLPSLSLLSNYIHVVTWFSIDAKLGRVYKRIVDPIHTYMAETPKEPWLPIEALGQILVWFVFCAMAAAAILGTLALVKC